MKKRIQSILMTLVMVICMCSGFVMTAHAGPTISLILEVQKKATDTTGGSPYYYAYVNGDDATDIRWNTASGGWDDATAVADINSALGLGSGSITITQYDTSTKTVYLSMADAQINHVSTSGSGHNLDITISGDCAVGDVLNDDDGEGWKVETNYTRTQKAIYAYSTAEGGNLTLHSASSGLNSLFVSAANQPVYAKNNLTIDSDFSGLLYVREYGGFVPTCALVANLGSVDIKNGNVMALSYQDRVISADNTGQSVTIGSAASVDCKTYANKPAIKTNNITINSSCFSIASVGDKAIAASGTWSINSSKPVIASMNGEPQIEADYVEYQEASKATYAYIASGAGYVFNETILEPEEGTIENDTDEIKTLFGITDMEEAIGVSVGLHVKDISKKVSDEDKALIKAAAKGQKVAMYIDLYPWKQVGNGDKEKVTTINGELLISVTVPESFRAPNREFAIAYVHEGETKVITPVSYDNSTGELKFKASEFSTYALIFKGVPDTGDNNTSLFVIVGLMLVFGTGLMVYSKKRERI